MDLAALRTRTRKIAGMEMTSLQSDAEVDAVINDVLTELCDAERWPFLEVIASFDTEAGTAAYDIPEDVSSPRAFVLQASDGPAPLDETSALWVMRYVDSARKGEPTAYARTPAGQVTLAPTPDAVYTVNVLGWKSHPPLTLAGDAPLFEAKYHPILAYSAAAILLSEEGQDERAEAQLDRAMSMLGGMRKHYMQSPDDEPIQLGSGARRVYPETGRLWPWRG